jgi:hypothetical protein
MALMQRNYARSPSLICCCGLFLHFRLIISMFFLFCIASIAQMSPDTASSSLTAFAHLQFAVLFDLRLEGVLAPEFNFDSTLQSALRAVLGFRVLCKRYTDESSTSAYVHTFHVAVLAQNNSEILKTVLHSTRIVQYNLTTELSSRNQYFSGSSSYLDKSSIAVISAALGPLEIFTQALQLQQADDISQPMVVHVNVGSLHADKQQVKCPATQSLVWPIVSSAFLSEALYQQCDADIKTTPVLVSNCSSALNASEAAPVPPFASIQASIRFATSKCLSLIYQVTAATIDYATASSYISIMPPTNASLSLNSPVFILQFIDSTKPGFSPSSQLLLSFALGQAPVTDSYCMLWNASSRDWLESACAHVSSNDTHAAFSCSASDGIYAVFDSAASFKIGEDGNIFKIEFSVTIVLSAAITLQILLILHHLVSWVSHMSRHKAFPSLT